MSRSIDPRCPYKLTPEQSSSVNELPCVLELWAVVYKRKQARDLYRSEAKEYKIADRRYQRALRELRNEKQRQRHRQVRENLERYENEQPVIDSERQAAAFGEGGG
jgi:Protein of unknown function (DUF3435)